MVSDGNRAMKSSGSEIKGSLIWAVIAALIVSIAVVQNSVAAENAVNSEDGTAKETTGLEEVIVTATRRQEDLQSIPVAVTAFTGETLEELGVWEAPDLAKYTPSLNVQGPYRAVKPQFSLRGVVNNGVNANTVSAVGIYVDQVYLNSPVSQGVTLFDLERVEILRGPQGTLYGANTTGGAINFISRKPEVGAASNGYLEAEYGNYDTWRIDAAMGIPIGDAVAVRVAYTHRESDGYRENTFTNHDQAFYETDAIRGQLAWEISDDVDVLFAAYYAQTDSDIAYEQQGARDPTTFALCSNADILANRCVDYFGYSDANQNNGFYEAQSAINPADHVDVLGLSMNIHWDIGEIGVTSITAFNNNEYNSFDDLSMSPFDNAILQYESSGEQWTQEIRLSSDSGDRFSWILGYFFLTEDSDEYEVVHGLSLVPFFGERAAAFKTYNLDVDSNALFGDVSYRLTDRTTLRGGLRWTKEKKELDFFSAFSLTPGISLSRVPLDFAMANLLFPAYDLTNEESWSELTGQASIEYAFNDDVMVYARYARGFRGGNFDATSLGSGSTVDPEYVDSYEVGMKSEWLDHKLRLNVAAYYSDYTDQQVTTIIPPVVVLANAAESTIKGMEIEIQAAPTPAWMLSAGLSFMNAEFDEFIDPSGIDRAGNELENTPATTFFGIIRYEKELENLGTIAAQFDASFKGDFYFDFSNSPMSRQDSYWLANVRITYTSPTERYSISAWCRNLGDEKYYVNWFDGSGFTGSNMYTTGEPRTYGVTAGLYWK